MARAFILFLFVITVSIDSYSQKQQPDFIVKKTLDTIFCKITMESSMSVFYTENGVGKSISKNEINNYKWNSKVISQNKNTTITIDTTLPKPKILLNYYTKTNINYTPSGTTNSTSQTVYTGFSVGGGSNIKFGWNLKNLGPYLMRDPESFVQFNKCVKYKKIKRVAAITFFSSLSVMTAMVISNGSGGTELIPFVALGGIAIPIYFVFNPLHYNMMKKSIRTYNKNAGFGDIYKDDN